MVPFVKSHGLGNDYLVMNQEDLTFPLTPRAIQWICHRNWGVGSDGILLLVPSAKAPFGLRIFNPDGSEAEKSGNGLRIFAKYLYEHGYTREHRLAIETPGGVVEAELRVEGDRVPSVAVEMGRATFRAPEIPVAGPDREVVGERVSVDGQELTVTCVSVGNPHCVVFVEELDVAEVRRLGPRIERHPWFPNRTNVQFAKVLGRDRVEIRIWERGAGYTLASGSSSSAVAAAAVRNDYTDGEVTILSPGGDLEVSVRSDWSIRLSGPVAEVCTGQLSAELIAAIHRGDMIPGFDP